MGALLSLTNLRTPRASRARKSDLQSSTVGLATSRPENFPATLVKCRCMTAELLGPLSEAKGSGLVVGAKANCGRNLGQRDCRSTGCAFTHHASDLEIFDHRQELYVEAKRDYYALRAPLGTKDDRAASVPCSRKLRSTVGNWLRASEVGKTDKIGSGDTVDMQSRYRTSHL